MAIASWSFAPRPRTSCRCRSGKTTSRIETNVPRGRATGVAPGVAMGVAPGVASGRATGVPSPVDMADVDPVNVIR